MMHALVSRVKAPFSKGNTAARRAHAGSFCESSQIIACPSPMDGISKKKLAIGKRYEIVPGRLYFSVHVSEEFTKGEIDRRPDLFFFASDCEERYQAFCHDFGPVNLGVVHDFCEFMHQYFNHPALQKRKLVYYTSDDVGFRTNAAFLISAFLLLHCNFTPEQAWAPFARMPENSFATFRDATHCPQDYHLSILACLQGLHKAQSLGWYDKDNFDVEEYVRLDNPNQADMHVLTPRFVAFKGPISRNNMRGAFRPEHYTKEFHDLGVSTVVRLNNPKDYKAEAFTENGFEHHECFFRDCSIPSNKIVKEFIRIAESSPGRVAVHCRAGLGRTGTLIAICLMKHHGFTASECIGWLRIMRPGSVIGPQQQYLHWAEENLVGRLEESQPLPEYDVGLSAEEAEEMGEFIAQAQADRCAVQEASSA